MSKVWPHFGKNKDNTLQLLNVGFGDLTFENIFLYTKNFGPPESLLGGKN